MTELTKEDLDFNLGTAMWKGKRLMDMTREELYEALNELGNLYRAELENKSYDL